MIDNLTAHQYKSSFAAYLGTDPNRIFLFWKGRVALYALLKSAGVVPGDEILIPAFTCVVVPNACIYHGAKPVYVEIDPLTYNIDINRIEEKITPRTKIILAQNTFGLSPDMDAIQMIAEKNRILVLEDCTHGFGGYYKGRKNGTIAAASFFSSQWNKPFSTGIGGMALVRDDKFLESMKTIESELISPSLREEWMLKLQIMARNNSFLNKFYWLQVKAYRFLSHHNFVIGSSSGEELDKPVMPNDYMKDMSQTQILKGISELEKFELKSAHRLHVAEKYKQTLSALNIKIPYEPEYATHGYLKFPILVKDRSLFLAEAEREGIELGEWFLSPIHPVLEHFEWWNYNYGEFPIAEKISRHILNLPTHEGIGEKQFGKIEKFIIKHQHSIVGRMEEI